jgi:hypothetical protein
LYPDLVTAGQKLVHLTGNTFINNTSSGTSGGGGVYYSCSLSGCQLYFTSNTFTDNQSSSIGGAVSWTYSKPDGLEGSTFSNNVAALYGNDVSSVAQKLKSVSQEYYDANVNVDGAITTVTVGDPYPTNTITNHQSGGVLSTMYFGIFDQYDSLVKSDSGSNLVVSVNVNPTDTYTPFLDGNTIVVSTRGLFKIENVGMSAAPGSAQTITFITNGIDDTVPSNVAYLASIGKTSSAIDFTVQIRYCQSGEAFKDNGEWQEWVAGQSYLLEIATAEKEWEPCPVEYAMCLGGNKIYPKEGYWRPVNTTDEFIECYTSSAWEGYTTQNQNELGGCSEGYQGIVWADCAPDYSRTSDFEWGKCPKHHWNIMRLVGLFILMILIIILLVKVTINSANNKRNELGVYNRILVNHLQMIVIIFSFRLQWPQDFISMFTTAEPAGEVSQQFISFDCFLDKRSNDDLDANPIPLFFYRVIISAAMPFVIILVSYIIWYIIFWIYHMKGSAKKELNKAKYKERMSKQRDARIIATNLIILLFIHPSMLEVLFDMFNCERIDGTLRLSKELETKCYKGKHLYFVVFLVIPSIILWGLGIPIYAIGKLLSKKKYLHKREVREELGYLYNGYIEKAFFWEPVILVRKMVMVLIATLLTLSGKKIQAMLVFIFMVFCLIIHNAVKPFMSRRLNQIEAVSIIALVISIYCGIFFVTDKDNNKTAKENNNDYALSDSEKLILFLLFLFSNLTFLIYWGVSYCLEARKYFRLKFPKFYYIICLCGNVKAIETEKRKRVALVRGEEMMDTYFDLVNLVTKPISMLRNGQEMVDQK